MTWIAPGILDPGVRAAVDAVPMVDAHEHLDEEAVRLKQPVNLTRFFMYYTFDEVASAGLPPEAEKRFWAEGVSGEEQWRMIREAWPHVRHSAYGRAVILSIRELYGIDDLRDETIGPLLRAIEKRNRPGVLDWILRKKCSLECCLVNVDSPGDLARRTESPGLFLFDIGIGRFMADQIDMKPMEAASGIQVASLKDWNRLIEWYFARWGKQAAAVKNVCAYWRTLRFDEVPEADAERLFEKWLVRKLETTPAERKAVQDWFFHAIIRLAIEYDLPVKIHTGYHAGHNYSDMDLFRARNLSNLFRRYPLARFDLFHIGYPEWQDVVALAKHYSNVFANLCWTWVIDPEAALDFARHALVALPLNKVIGFGGDYGFADVVYGHARIARDGVAKVLTEAVREGRLTAAEAGHVARRWLRDNAMELYRIEARRAAQAAGQPPPLPGGG